MGFFDFLWPEKKAQMILEVEGCDPVINPSEDEIISAVMSLDRPGPTYASLTDELGNYVQVGGARPWSTVEWRQTSPTRHWRANTQENRKPYKDGASIHFSAGSVSLREDEWILLKQATEVFRAFNRREQFPAYIGWRDVTAQLGA